MIQRELWQEMIPIDEYKAEKIMKLMLRDFAQGMKHSEIIISINEKLKRWYLVILLAILQLAVISRDKLMKVDSTQDWARKMTYLTLNTRSTMRLSSFRIVEHVKVTVRHPARPIKLISHKSQRSTRYLIQLSLWISYLVNLTQMWRISLCLSVVRQSENVINRLKHTTHGVYKWCQ